MKPDKRIAFYFVFIAALAILKVSACNAQFFDGHMTFGGGAVNKHASANLQFVVTYHLADATNGGILPTFAQPVLSDFFVQAGISGMSNKYAPGGEAFFNVGLQGDNQRLALAAGIRYRFVQDVERQVMRTAWMPGASLQYRAGMARFFIDASPNWFAIGVGCGAQIF